MNFINLILIFLTKIIKILIFIIGKTIVLYILVFKSWYLEIINFIFQPNYNDLYQCNLIILVWNLFSWFLQIILIFFSFYLIYLYFLLLKFLFFKIIKEINLFFKYKN